MLSQLNLSHLVILCATITTFLFSCKKSNEPINELNANFISQPDSIYLFNKVNFTAIDTTQNADYYWDFGDSTTLITSESKISHKYKLKGSHTVTLKIKGVISNKKVYVYPGDISYKIINLSSKDIDFKSYVNNLENGSLFRKTIKSNSSSDTLYATVTPYFLFDVLHLLGGSIFLNKKEYVLYKLNWMKSSQNNNIIITDTTSLVERFSNETPSKLYMLKDL